MTVDHPLAWGGPTSFADAKAALGAPLVLPDTSPMGSPKMGPVWLASAGDESGSMDNTVAVTYPAARLWIDYQNYDLYDDDVLLWYHGIARSSPGFRVINIDGVPASAYTEDSFGAPGSLLFEVGGIRVEIIGHQDGATLQALARSIISGYAAAPAGQLGNVGGIQLFTYYPPGRQIDLSDVSRTLGAPVVIPDTSPANAGNADQAWAERDCPAPDARITEQSRRHPCWIWVSFSSSLSVGYLRPAPWSGTQGEWEQQARMYGPTGATGAREVGLGNVPALAIEPAGPYPGSVEFDLDGTRVVVAGNYDTATLQAVAQSIVDRAAG